MYQYRNYEKIPVVAMILIKGVKEFSFGEFKFIIEYASA